VNVYVYSTPAINRENKFNLIKFESLKLILNQIKLINFAKQNVLSVCNQGSPRYLAPGGANYENF
jgi:hypothetical protein